MNINDWFPVPMDENIHMFSANGVHWPLDEYLESIGQPTTNQIAEKIKKAY